MPMTEQEIGLALQQAVAYLQSGQHAAAENELASLLAQVPDCKPARFYLGTCLLQQDERRDEGAAILKPLLDDELVAPAVLINLGLYYFVTEDFAESERLYRKALESKPYDADLHNKLACSCHAQKRFPESVFHFQQALMYNPALVEAYAPLVGTLRNLGRWIEAYVWACRWARVEPTSLKVFAEQGVAVANARLYGLAKELGSKIPEQDPELQFYSAALCHHEQRIPEAIRIYRSVLAQDPSLVIAEFNLSLLLLGEGELVEGWQKFDARFDERAPLGPHGQTAPEWDGRELHGEGILVHSEQGIGDVIQFMRFFPLIQQRGGRVIFASYGDVLTLLKAESTAAVVSEVAELDLSYQWQIPLVSLGKVFAHTVEDIPAEVPYISAPADKTQLWHARLVKHLGLKVGLVWAGNAIHTNDHNRSTELADFAPLATVAGVDYFALQKGPTAAQAACPPSGLSLTSLSDDISDFTDTAAIVAALDLVICVDTSVAHLAGALGKPVWLLLPDMVDWRWLRGRDDSPWYPGMRLFRRGKDETWLDVLGRVAVALEGLCAQASGLDAAWQAERRGAQAAANGALGEAALAWSEAVSLGGSAPRLASQIVRAFEGTGSAYEGRFPEGQAYLQACLKAPVEPLAALPYWQALATQTGDMRASLRWVECLQQNGAWAESIDLAQQLLARQPEQWMIRLALAQGLRRQGRDEEAEQAFAEVLRVSPRHPQAGINRAMALHRLGKLTDALKQLQYTAMCHPYHPKVRLYLAILLFLQRQYQLAQEVAAEHRLRFPEDDLTLYWHGAILRQLGRYPEALAALQAAVPGAELSAFELLRERIATEIALDWRKGKSLLSTLRTSAPADAAAQIESELGLYLLTNGEYEAGWCAFEARRQVKGSDTFAQQFPRQLPLWEGDALAGRRLLVYCEQGFGDTLQFLRYLGAFDGECIVVYQDGLQELLAVCYQRPGTQWISRSAYRHAPVGADCHIDLLSLPRVLGLDADALSASVPYLVCAEQENPFVSQFGDEQRPRVGVVWAGNSRHAGDHWRSMDLLALKPLFALDAFAWYSLQKDAAANDMLLLPAEMTVLNAAALCDNFLETYFVIEQLDLVITVDTAVAHLAGAMGKPVWLLLPEQADWRWGRDGEQTAWYPGMRLFRQQKQGEWGAVVGDLLLALQQHGAVHA